nr:sushi, von Willebrand factor type A, EGF and pentraxin domain-containing protein 1 [Bactrocera oleae]
MIKEGSYLEYSCEYGYKLNGANRSTCTNNGWNSDAPTCKQTTCDAGILNDCTSPLNCERFDFAMNNYRRIYKGNVQQLSQLEYLHLSCDDGYDLQGTQFLTCMGGKWEGSMPKCAEQTTCDAGVLNACTSPLNCERFDFAINNYKRIYKGNVQQLSQLEYLHLSCDDGYDLQGTQYLTCKGGKWQGTMPKCNERISNTCDKRILDNCTYPLICKRFDREFNDFRKINSATRQKSVIHMERIKVSCENGYVLDGRNVLSCAAGKWDHHMPKCIASSCRGDLIPRCKHPLTCSWYDSKSQSEQIITDNNITESTSYALNTQIVFGCANGYKLEGEEQTICTSNGWTHKQSHKLPECTSECDPDIFKSCKKPLICFYLEPNKNWLEVRNDFLINKISENSFIHFRCVNDYMLQGVDYINCNSKGWDHPMPECVSAFS